MELVDPITCEVIPEGMEIEVEGIHFSVDTLYTAYVKAGSKLPIQNPFTRQPLSEEQQARVLDYGKSKKITLTYDGKEYLFDSFELVGNALARFIFEDKDYSKEDILCGDISAFTLIETSVNSLTLHEFVKSTTEWNKENYIKFLTQEELGINEVVLQKIVTVYVSFSEPSLPPLPNENELWQALQGTDRVLFLLDESLMQMQPNDFYFSLVESECAPNQVLDVICTGPLDKLRERLLTALWYGKGLRCTANSIIPLLMLSTDVPEIMEIQIRLIGRYFSLTNPCPSIQKQHLAYYISRLIN